MKITSRQTHNFIELNVDEIEATIYKSDPNEIKEMIFNLISVADNLASYTDKSLNDLIDEYYSL